MGRPKSRNDIEDRLWVLLKRFDSIDVEAMKKIVEQLERIETQNRGILNLQRMLFKLLREPESVLPKSKYQVEPNNLTTKDKPR